MSDQQQKQPTNVPILTSLDLDSSHQEPQLRTGEHVSSPSSHPVTQDPSLDDILDFIGKENISSSVESHRSSVTQPCLIESQPEPSNQLGHEPAEPELTTDNSPISTFTNITNETHEIVELPFNYESASKCHGDTEGMEVDDNDTDNNSASNTSYMEMLQGTSDPSLWKHTYSDDIEMQKTLDNFSAVSIQSESIEESNNFCNYDQQNGVFYAIPVEFLENKDFNTQHPLIVEMYGPAAQADAEHTQPQVQYEYDYSSLQKVPVSVSTSAQNVSSQTDQLPNLAIFNKHPVQTEVDTPELPAVDCDSDDDVMDEVNNQEFDNMDMPAIAKKMRHRLCNHSQKYSKSSPKLQSTSKKPQVHRFIGEMLHLSSEGSPFFKDKLFFCDAKGNKMQNASANFKIIETVAVGELWGHIKGNKVKTFETLAKAMRVARKEKYFDYLDGGKGTKKRLYKLGPKSCNEFQTLFDWNFL